MSVVHGSSTSTSAVFLEVEAFGWVAEDRLELRGRWSGVRGIRLVRPTVVLHLADKGQKRLLASLEHKPWTAMEGEEWVAAFDWTGVPVPAESAQLSVGTDLSFEIPTPTVAGGRRVPPPSREQQAEASRRAAHRERDTVNRALESLRGDYADLESRLQVTLAQRDEARQRRDQMRVQLEAALTERQRADAERDQAVDGRDDAIVSRDAAIADREETLEARNVAVRGRQQAERELAEAEAGRDTALSEQAAALEARDDAITRAERAEELARTAELERQVAVQAAQDARDAIPPRDAAEVLVGVPEPSAAQDELVAGLKAQVAELETNLGKATKARRKALAERDDALQHVQRTLAEPLAPRHGGSRAQRFQTQPLSERDAWSPLQSSLWRGVALLGLIVVIVGILGVLSVF